MNPVVECWGALAELQESLKKEFLLVEKEQQEKVKLKREIEELVRCYHRQAIELYSPGSELLKEEGFDNCYNFIKDVVVTLSSDHRLGKLILFLAEDNLQLASLVVHGLYENIETHDPYAKEITRLMHSLMGDLQEQLPPSRQQAIIQAWKLYM
jgi:hypothetical protein